jgi:ABC-type sugar transport system ATPase subunit
MEAVRLENVWKSYNGRPVLAGVDLSVALGEVVVIVGPNGSGKTTLARIIVGLEKPDHGNVYLLGRAVHLDSYGTIVPAEERGIGYVPQGIMLLPHLTLYDNIAFGLRVRGLPEHEVRERVIEVAKLLEIEDHLEAKPTSVSGGIAQRAALARALVLKPKLLVLDEPFSHVDPWSRSRLRRLLVDYVRENGAAAIVMSHDLDDVRYADRSLALVDGKLKAYQTY